MLGVIYPPLSFPVYVVHIPLLVRGTRVEGWVVSFSFAALKLSVIAGNSRLASASDVAVDWIGRLKWFFQTGKCCISRQGWKCRPVQCDKLVANKCAKTTLLLCKYDHSFASLDTGITTWSNYSICVWIKTKVRLPVYSIASIIL